MSDRQTIGRGTVTQLPYAAHADAKMTGFVSADKMPSPHTQARQSLKQSFCVWAEDNDIDMPISSDSILKQPPKSSSDESERREPTGDAFEAWSVAEAVQVIEQTERELEQLREFRAEHDGRWPSDVSGFEFPEGPKGDAQ